MEFGALSKRCAVKLCLIYRQFRAVIRRNAEIVFRGFAAPRTGTVILVQLVVAVGATPAFSSSACPRESPPASVEEVAPGVFVRRGAVAVASAGNGNAIANIGFVVGSNSVAVIDTGGSACDGAALRAAILARTDLPIRYVVNTHVHPDHMLGNAAFVQDTPAFIGHRRLPAALAARGPYYLDVYRGIVGAERFGTTTIVPPTRTVDATDTLDLGDRELVLTAFPPGHTDNDLTVLDRKTGTLFTGDLVFLEHIPVVDGDLKGWLATIGALEAMPGVARAVPGHGPASVPWPDGASAEKAYLTRLGEGVRKLVAAGAPMHDAKGAAADEAAKWQLADEFHERNANAAYAEAEWEE